eukprot:jgi/Chlat1/1352/Chrsp119S01763
MVKAGLLLLLLPALVLLGCCAPAHAQKEQQPGYAAYPGMSGGSSQVTATAVNVDIRSLAQQIMNLSLYSSTPPPSVTRVLYTDEDIAARKYIKQLMQAAGLNVQEDAVGNIFGRWEGEQPELGAVGTGSHIDAIPLAGRFDGVVGVLGGIEALAALKRSGFKPRRSLEVVMFTSEEPTRFGVGCSGSRLMAGLDSIREYLMHKLDKDNMTFFEAATYAGYHIAQHDEEALRSVEVPSGAYDAFVELHIEQGPLLEQEDVPIGIVTAIAAPAGLKVEFHGFGGHAGAVLMPYRNDAGLAAAELALAVEAHVLATQSNDTVGTTGRVELLPGAVNSIPRDAYLEIDVRDINGDRRNSVVESIITSAHDIAERRKVQHKIEASYFSIVNQDPPAICGEAVVRAAEEAAIDLGLAYKKMVSRAYHDSLFMARIAPTGMIFIPCHKGISHRPDEFASDNHILQGVHVLALTMAKLSLL